MIPIDCLIKQTMRQPCYSLTLIHLAWICSYVRAPSRMPSQAFLLPCLNSKKKKSITSQPGSQVMLHFWVQNAPSSWKYCHPWLPLPSCPLELPLIFSLLTFYHPLHSALWMPQKKYESRCDKIRFSKDDTQGYLLLKSHLRSQVSSKR